MNSEVSETLKVRKKPGPKPKPKPVDMGTFEMQAVLPDPKSVQAKASLKKCSYLEGYSVGNNPITFPVVEGKVKLTPGARLKVPVDVNEPFVCSSEPLYRRGLMLYYMEPGFALACNFSDVWVTICDGDVLGEVK